VYSRCGEKGDGKLKVACVDHLKQRRKKDEKGEREREGERWR
jgi:hypothetical protein